jgi:hypothetical protein
MIRASNNQQEGENTKQTHRKEDKTCRKSLQRKNRPSGLTRSSQLTRLYTESFGILQMLKF